MMSNITETSTPDVDAAPMFPYLFVSIAIVIVIQRLNMSAIASLLAGLNVYMFPSQEQATASATATKTAELAVMSRKQQKRLEKSKQVQTPETSDMLSYLTTTNYIKSLLYYSLFDNVVLFLVFYTINWCLSVVAFYYNVPSNPALELFAACTIGVAMYCVAEVELLGEWTLNQEKVMIWMAASFCTVVSGLLLLLGPKYVLDFQIEAGTRHLNNSLMATVTSFFQARPALRDLVPEPGHQLFDPMSVTASLAVLAGGVAAVTLGASTRWAKLYLHAVHPPHWVLGHFNTGVAMHVLLGAGLLAPFATVILWILPLTDVMGLDAEVLRWLRPASATLSGVLHLLLLRKLTQTFLTTTMLEWWGISNRGSSVDATLVQRLRVRNQFLNQYITGKVVLQLLVTATLLLITGSISIYSLLSESMKGTPKAASFVQTWAGFISWWTSLWWFGVTSLTVVFHRMGFAELSSS